jgi:arylsulfatase A
MNRRDFLKTASVSLAALSLPACRSTAAGNTAAAGNKPNIIFILSDDVGITDIHCCGGDHFKTPHIDALAQNGTRFEYCYSTPLCGPSRCQILTGRYPFRTGLINNQSDNAINPANETMLPMVLKQAGYITASAGKWGQMAFGPGEWGFDEYLGVKGSGKYWRAQAATYYHNGKVKELPEGKYLPNIMHDFVIDFINRNKERPFFLYYPMVHVHGPIVRTPDSAPGSKDLYTDNVTYMDKLVGHLIQELENLKLREKTLVIFAGDNGTAKFGIDRATIGGRHIHGMKGTMLEGGSRVPLLINWSGTTPTGVVNHDLVDFSDIFPTLAEFAGAKLPAGKVMDGHSFAAQIKGEKGQPREWVYVELNGNSYVRSARYKLTNHGDLFDLKDAPFTEEPVPADTTDAGAIAARKRLQEILAQLPTAPGGAGAGKKKKKQQQRQNRQQQPTV